MSLMGDLMAQNIAGDIMKAIENQKARYERRKQILDENDPELLEIQAYINGLREAFNIAAKYTD